MSQIVSLGAEGEGSKVSVCMSLVDCTKINCLHSTAHYIILVIIIEFCHLLWGEPPAP